MAAVDAFSIREVESSASQAKRWSAGVAVAVALHGLAFLYLNRAPAPVGFESQSPIELDMLPPPSGAAQMDEAGANATTPVAPEETVEPQELEELKEIEPEEVQPPPETEITTAEPRPEDVETIEELPDIVETPPAAQMQIPPDVTAAPPEVDPAVTLPPQEAVTAQEEELEPPKPEPKPVAKKVEPKPERKIEPKREAPKRDAKPADSPKPATPSQQAGGRSGASANAGAARAAASAYGARVRAAVAAQKRSGNLSGRAVVSFTVTRSGAVTGVSASGPGPAAAEAAAMVRRAGIPAMPAEMTASSARYTLPVSFTPGR